MRYCILLALLLSMCSLLAQTGDTTVYVTASQMPRFPACENVDTTLEAKITCAEAALLRYIYQRIVYPPAAIEEEIEGTVVISFIVEKNGFPTAPEIVRDLGGGTGEAALQVIGAMQRDGIRWVPARNDSGDAVRVRVNVPVRFKLEDAPYFRLIGRDTVYVRYDEPLDYEGGGEALQAYLDEAITYPVSGNDSCLIGQIDVQLLVDAEGQARVLDLTDYNDLGFDFWYEAIRASTSTRGNWIPATLEGRSVPTAFDLSLNFLPTAGRCQTRIDQYQAATAAIEAGTELLEAEDLPGAIGQFTTAVEMFPDDAQFRMIRGQAYLDNNQLAEACVDLSKARRLALVNWFDGILPLICR